MKKIVLTLLIGIFPLAVVAAPLEVSRSITLDAKVGKIWHWFGNFCAIKRWHPAVEKCEVSKEGAAEFRTLTLGDGGKIKEKHTGGTVYGYSYIITDSPLPVKDYSSDFYAEQSGGQAKLTWTVKFSAKGATDPEAKSVVTGIVESGLASIKEKYMHKKQRWDKHKKRRKRQ